ncbi:MAG: globin family protein, partial [Xenococcus sp. (in: cyanobacteria)]
MSLQIELLEQSFNYIKPYGNQFVNKFYENLFDRYPEIESLFTSIDIETRNNQLWDDLVLIIENLNQPDILKNIIQGLGVRLDNYGILSEHYPLAKNTLLSTFKQFLGSAWTAEFEQAWQDAYVTFGELMLEGVEQTHKKEEEEEEEVVIVTNSNNSLVEDFSPTFVTEEQTLEKEVIVTNTNNVLLEEFLPTPISKSEATLAEKIEAVVDNDNSLTEDIWSTPVTDLEATLDAKTEAVASVNDSLAEDFPNTPISQSTEILEEKTEAVASVNDSLAEDFPNT